MRIRSVKPEFWGSDDITCLPFAVRLLFIGLWSYVDDNGVGIDDYRKITAALFALEEDQDATREYVQRGLELLAETPPPTLSNPFPEAVLMRYEVAGKRYLFVRNWDAHQRVPNPNPPRHPRPEADAHAQNAECACADGMRTDPNAHAGAHTPTCENESLRRTKENLGTGVVEQGSSGTEKDAHAHLNALFEEFWKTYPRKIDKKRAQKAWSAAVKRADPKMLIEAAGRYLVEKQGVEQKFVKHAATWLNGDCWINDEDAEASPVGFGRDAAAEWVRGEWKLAKVRAIEERANMRYSMPDLPNSCVTKDDVVAFHANARREWIAANHDEIVRRLTVKAVA